MAALIRHGSLISPHSAKNSLLSLIKAPVRHDVVRCKANRAKQKQKQSTIKGKWEWSEKSLSTRGASIIGFTGVYFQICRTDVLTCSNSDCENLGHFEVPPPPNSSPFLRPLKPYEPPADASEKLDKICKAEGLSENDSTEIKDLNLRFKLFSACANEFKCHIPNSVMFTIRTIGDLRNFYHTPINTTLPLEATKDLELPPNLHIQYEYNRFNPETDTKFGGKTAFPKSSTLVTGLKYKKKYPSLILDSPWS
ncbi:Similar to MRPL50: 39S ribosomal protein L50 [Cotesia congregata]|uniref:Large ribosomal subunit protein mL50 n=1 Tax=Cotesia congregata TaxID=51543 RepID=A0A8J2HAU1_COTCN|nr:Similar to MRPL50: 39S ribosomal protein L50 [Cotesia congregata]